MICFTLTFISLPQDESHRIVRPQLPQLPEFGMRYNNRTYKPTQAGPIRSEQNRHVTGEIQCADRICIVVNVGWVQSCLAAVFARPLWPWTNQPHTRSIGVVVDFP